MAFASVGTFISQADKSGSSSTYSPVTEASTSAGQLLVILLASDNIATSIGSSNNHSSVSLGGQSFTKLYEYTYSAGVAADGATSSVWVLQNANASTSGDTVTVNWSGALTAKAIAGWRFTMDNAKALTDGGGAQFTTAASADPPSQTISGLSSREYLFIRAIACEAQTTTFTATTNYTQFDITGAQTAGGGSGMAVRGEFRILTGTGDSSNPTYVTNDNANIYLALYEATTGAFTLTSDTVAFVLTGSATGLRAQRKLTAAAASFALTGNATALNRGFSLAASAGSFTLTGNATGFTAQRKLSAEVGAFTLTGNAAALNHGFPLAAAVGSFTLTGVAASLIASRKLTAETGSFALTGNAAALNHGYRLTAQAGAFTLTGVDVGLEHGMPGAYTLSADPATFSLTGNAAGLLAGRKLACVAGEFVLSGQDAALTYADVSAYTLTAEAGNFVLTGSAVNLATESTATYGGFDIILEGLPLKKKKKKAIKRRVVKQIAPDIRPLIQEANTNFHVDAYLARLIEDAAREEKIRLDAEMLARIEAEIRKERAEQLRMLAEQLAEEARQAAQREAEAAEREKQRRYREDENDVLTAMLMGII